MGNTQPPMKRDRADSGSGANRSPRAFDDECPVQVKIPKKSPGDASQVSMQYAQTNEYPVVIKWSGTNAKNIYLSGSWNGWKTKLPLVKSHDDFTTIINLPEGRHEFKFNVDGKWVCDNNLPKTDNGLGSDNNVIVIDHADFEVFDALDRDMQNSSSGGSTGVAPTVGGQANVPANPNQFAAALSQDASFCQDIPDRKAFEAASHPPVLPPHLLQVILNKDTPVHCDPNVLPEPNHVMLNHLYALSIKDGVMVLSATHRYRKKYVTTLLYKPI